MPDFHEKNAINRRAYWSYVRLSLAAQIAPLSARDWLLLSEKSVINAWNDFARRMSQRLDENIAEETMEHRGTPDWVQMGFRVVELRPNGTLGGVRRQTVARRGRDKHVLTIK